MPLYQVDFHAPFAQFDLGPTQGGNDYKFPEVPATSNVFTYDGITYTFSASTTLSGTSPFRLMDLTNASWGSQNRYDSAGNYTGSITTSLPSNPAYAGEFIQVQLSIPLAYSTLQFQRNTGGGQVMRHPITYVLAASNDGLNWTELLNVTNNTASVGTISFPQGIAGQFVNFYPVNIGYYTYYRFITNAISPGNDTSFPAYVRELRAYAPTIFPSPFSLSFKLPLHYHYSYLPVYLRSVAFHTIGPDMKSTHLTVKLDNVANFDQLEHVNILSQKKTGHSLRHHFVDIYLGHVTGNVLEGSIVLSNQDTYLQCFHHLSIVLFIDSEYM